jgi:large repetitive protein
LSILGNLFCFYIKKYFQFIFLLSLQILKILFMKKIFTLILLLFTFSSFSQLILTADVNSGCPALNVNLQITNYHPDAFYVVWDYADGPSELNQSDVAFHVYNNEGFYTVYATVYDQFLNVLELASTTITVENLAISDGGFTDPTTCGGNDGEITISGVGMGNLSWTGTNPGNVFGYTLGDPITGLSAGNYDFTLTQGACVSNTVSITLTDPAGAVIADGGFIDPTTCGGNDGEITISGLGMGDLSWTGTNPGNVFGYTLGDPITGLSAGNYDFTLTQGACVSNTVSITLTDPAGAVIADGGFIDPTTCGGNDGEITISGLGMGDLSWTGTNPGNVFGYTLGDPITGLSAGNYDFTLTQGACVSNTVSITLTDPAGAVIADGGFIDPTTCGGNDGEITISGLGMGDLSWTGTNPGNVFGYVLGDPITGLSAGNYDFTLTQGACVSNTVSITLTDPAGTVIADGGSIDPTTCGGNDGEITISGLGMGDLSWTGTNPGNIVGYTLGDPITTLSAGTYDFTLTQGACVSNTVSITLTDPAGAVIADGGFIDPTTCGGNDGEITISGVGMGNLSWTGTNPGNVFGYTLGDPITGLSAGNYDFTLTQGACVSNTVSITLTDPAGAVIADGGFIDPTTCGGNDGEITISGVGMGDLSWTGTNPGNIVGYTLGDPITTLSAGTYDFTFTQGACVSNTVSITLFDPAGTVIADGGFIDPTTCGGNDGEITISGVGMGDLSWTGTNPGNVFGYVLGDPITGLSAGNYDFTLTQGACVSNTVSITLTDPAGTVIADGGSIDPTTCGGNDGEITISGLGMGDLSWTGTNPGNIVGYTLGDPITTLSAGTYDFTLTQGACVSNTVSITLTDPAGAVIADGGFIDPTTCGGNDGEITISGVGMGDLSWTGTNPGNIVGYTLGDPITTLSAGTYDFTFTQGACVSNTVSITLFDPAGTVIADGGSIDPTTCGGNDGEITIAGAGMGDLSWTGTNPGNVFGYTLGDPITGLSAGNYDFTLTQGACVSNTVSITLTDPAGTVIADGGSIDPTTCGGNDGEITISGLGMGDLSWTGTNPGNIVGYTLGDPITTLSAGTYDFTFTQGACVSNTVSITLFDPAGTVIADGGSIDPTTCGGNDGEITIAGAGMGDLSWTGTNPGNIVGYTLGDPITTLSAGTYDFTFTQGACVSNTVSITLFDPAGTVIADGGSIDPTTCGGNDGEITIAGAGMGDLSWTGTNPGNIVGYTLGDPITTLSAGAYDFTFTQGACVSNTVSITLFDPAGTVIADGGSIDPTTCGGNDGEITIAGAGMGDLSWTGTNPGNIVGYTLGDPITTLSAGTYDFTFTQGACVSNTVSITLTDPIIVISEGSVFGPFSCGANDAVLEIMSPSFLIGDLMWTGTSVGMEAGFFLNSTTFSTFGAGTYNFTFTDGFCTSNTISVTISDPGAPATPTITANGPLTFCDGGSVTLSSSSTDNNIWSTGETSQDISVTSTGIYSVFVSDGGCNSLTSLDVLVTINPVQTISLGITQDPSICGNNDGIIEILGAGFGDIEYFDGTNTQIDFGVNLPYSITGLVAGTYEITFNDACVSNTVNASLSDPGAPATPIITTSGPTTFCDGDFVVLSSSSATDNVWSTGETTQDIIVTTSGNYSLFLSVASCNSPSIFETVTVNPIPATPTISSSDLDNEICDGEIITLTSSSALDNIWSTGETTQSIDINSSQVVNVTVNTNGCSAISTDETIIVNPVETILFGLILDPSQCGATDGSIEILGTMTGDLTYTGPISNTEFGITLPFTLSNLPIGTYDFIFNSGICSSNSINTTLISDPAPAIPTITASGATTFCDGDLLTLTSSSLSDNLWSTGETTQSIVVNSSGIYNVTVTSGLCSETSLDEVIIVNPIPATPTISASGSTTFCDGDFVTLTSSSLTDNVWSTGETTESIDVFTSQTVSLSLTVNGCSSGTVSEIITVNVAPAVPTISLSSSNNICDGETVTLTSSSPTDNLWSTGETTQSIDVNISGAFNVTVSNGICSETSLDEIITVTPFPATPTIIASGSTTICDGDFVTLTSSSPIDNLWSTGETSESIVVSTDQTVSLSIITNGCSSNSVEEIITVNPIPATPTITPNGGTTICSGSTLILNSSALIGNMWSTGASTQNINVTASGTYILQVEELGCLSNTASIAITVNPTPNQPLVFVQGSTSFCEGGSVVLTSSVPTNILWSTGETDQSIVVNSTQDVSVSTTAFGCTSTSEIVNVVSNLNPVVNIMPYDDICNTAAPFSYFNGVPSGGFYDLNGNPSTLFEPAFAILGSNNIVYTFIDQNGCSGSANTTINVYDCVELNEEILESFVIFPNPTNGNVIVKGNLNNNLQSIEVRDELGRIVFVQTDVFVETTLNLSDLADGMYSLILKGNNFEKIERIQLIK